MLKRFPFAFGLTWGVVLFLLPLPLIQTLAVGLPSLYASEALAIQAGSVAYVWMLAAIYLATRPAWLDRLIGLPSIYMVHGMLSLLAILLAYLHKSGTVSSGWIKTTGDWAFDLLLFLMVYSLVFMAGWLTNRLPPLARLKRWLERYLKHELSVWLHRLNLIAVALVFVHVQLISYVTAIHPYMWWFDGLTAVVAASYAYAKLRDAWWLPQGKLTTKRELAANFYEFTFRLGRRARLAVKPGDYVFVRFPDYRGLGELHPFSVVNAVTDRDLVLAIRGDGDFTKSVQGLPVGAVANFAGGFGRFDPVLTEQGQRPLVLVAGGSGVVPKLAILQAYQDRPVTLYYSAHRAKDLIYVPQLQALAAQRPNLSVHVQQGRFDVARSVAAELTQQAVWLLAGPARLGHAWQHALARAGVAADAVYYEEFSW